MNLELAIKRLITNECANHERKFNGFINVCLAKEDCKCVFFFEKYPRCKYFEEAVLPLDKRLEQLYYADRKARAQGYELTEQQKRIIVEDASAGKITVKCERCKEEFPAVNNRQKYCAKCRKWAAREREQTRRQEKKELERDRLMSGG